MFARNCSFNNMSETCWPDDGEDILDDVESSPDDSDDRSFLSKLFTSGQSSSFHNKDDRDDYFGHLVEEESDIPDSTIDEFEQLLAVLRNMNRSAAQHSGGTGADNLGTPASQLLPEIFCKLFQDEFTVWDYLIMVVYGVIIIISLFGNFLVFSVIIKTRRLHTITNLFIANLAFGDLLMTTFNIPFTVVRLMLDDWPFGGFMCSVVPFTQSVSVFVSSYTMTAIAVDRYHVISTPLHVRAEFRDGYWKLAMDLLPYDGKVVYRQEGFNPVRVDFYIFFNNNRWGYGQEGFENNIQIFQSLPVQGSGETACPTDKNVVWEWFDGSQWRRDDRVEILCLGLTLKSANLSNIFQNLTEEEIRDVVEEVTGMIVSKEVKSITDKITMISSVAMEFADTFRSQLETLKEELVNIKEAIIEGNHPTEVKITVEDNKNQEELDNTFYVGHNSVSSPPESYGVIALDPGYRKQFPHDQGTNVSVDMEILGITKIDSLTKVVGLEIDITLGWEDRRINWTQGGPQVNQGLEFSSSVLKDLWKPDSYFANQDTHEEVTALNFGLTDERFSALKPSQDSKIKLKYSHKVKVAVKCNMDFEHFPFDSQTCKFLMKSLRGQDDLFWEQAVIHWSPGRLFHPEFHVWVDRFNKTTVRERNKSVSVSGFYFVMFRKPTPFIYSYFAPCALLVVTSWISFAVKFEAVPGRLGLLLTLLLMMINLSNTVSRSIPKSDNMCPLILWIVMSIIFVALALLEYLIILMNVNFFGSNKIPGREEACHSMSDWALKLDKVALVVFPFGYFIGVFVFVLRVLSA